MGRAGELARATPNWYPLGPTLPTVDPFKTWSGIRRTNMVLKVTFDSNTYRLVVEPEHHVRHLDQRSLATVHGAIKSGAIKPYACEAMFTLEAILKIDRAHYLATRRLQIDVVEQASVGNRVRGSVSVSPDHAQHPGLDPREVERLEKSLTLGFRLLGQPRIGMAQPEETRRSLHPEQFAEDDDIELRQNVFGQLLREIENRGVGFARAKALGDRARQRAGSPVPWFALLADDNYFNANERKEIAAAVGEWVDGDNLAAHIAYGNDVFCTHDSAGKNRPSILNDENRTWLTTTYGVTFATLSELASRIPA